MSEHSMAFVSEPRAPFEGPSLLHLAEMRQGLTVAVLDTLAARVAPKDKAFRYRLVPKATLARRRAAGGRLTPEESERVIRYANVFNFASEVWGGDEHARGFMDHPNMVLRDQRPMDLTLSGEVGAKLVYDHIGQTKHGVAI